MPKSKVFVLYAGGTFGMVPDQTRPGSPLVPMEVTHLIGRLPDMDGVGIEVSLQTTPAILDSSSMTPRDWVLIAERIYENYERYDGFVVIHGTDTLAYTASALSFMFENLSKPIVVTGSQLPVSSERTDAIQNYAHAVMVAGHRASSLPRIPEVVVVFGNKILRGCRTRKVSTEVFMGFESPNFPPLGEIGEHIRINERQLLAPPPSDLQVQLNAILDSDVLDISLYPGLKAHHVRSILSLDGIKGVVLRTFGTGNAPDTPEFLEALRDGIMLQNKIVVNISQCVQGTVEMGLYATSVGLIDCGVISGLDMTPEAALTKMMVMLGSCLGEQVRVQMQINQRGEQSGSVFFLAFPSRSARDGDRYAEYVVPDRRFNRDQLSSAVLRVAGFAAEVDENEVDPAIYIFMNYPRARVPELNEKITKEQSKLLYKLHLGGKTHYDPFALVEVLSTEQIKNIVGDGGITLTLVFDFRGQFLVRAVVSLSFN